MKLAFFTTLERFPWGGSEELWFKTASYALAQKHQVLISVPEWDHLHPNISNLCNDGAILHLRKRFIPQPPQRFYVRALKRLKFLLSKPQSEQSYQAVLAFQPDVICISQGGSYDICWHLNLQNLLLQLQKPFTFIAQFNLEICSLSYQEIVSAREIYKKASQIFFVSERNRQTAQRQLVSKLQNSSVVFNPVNLTDTAIVDWYISSQIAFACVARLDCAFKGQDILLQVLSGEVWRKRSWILNLYGQGPDENYLRELVQFYGLTGKVNFCGQVSNIRQVWESNHIQLMPSIAEGTPLALVEAMLCGRPSVVTDVGGNADFTLEARTGFVAAAPTPKAFGDAMERAWIALDEWQQMGKEAHAFALKKVDLFPEKALLKHLLSFTLI